MYVTNYLINLTIIIYNIISMISLRFLQNLQYVQLNLEREIYQSECWLAYSNVPWKWKRYDCLLVENVNCLIFQEIFILALIAFTAILYRCNASIKMKCNRIYLLLIILHFIKLYYILYNVLSHCDFSMVFNWIKCLYLIWGVSIPAPLFQKEKSWNSDFILSLSLFILSLLKSHKIQNINYFVISWRKKKDHWNIIFCILGMRTF